MAEMHDRIKNMRLAHGYTLAFIAEYLDTTEATAQRYETGKGIKSIPYDVLVKYGKLFNCNPAYFLGWDVPQINSIDESQKQANAYQDEVETELAPLFEMNLTKEEAQELVKYAKFLVSQRG